MTALNPRTILIVVVVFGVVFAGRIYRQWRAHGWRSLRRRPRKRP